MRWDLCPLSLYYAYKDIYSLKNFYHISIKDAPSKPSTSLSLTCKHEYVVTSPDKFKFKFTPFLNALYICNTTESINKLLSLPLSRVGNSGHSSQFTVINTTTKG